MLIGIDLDNTIVCYDAVFADLASEAGLPEEVAAAGKQAIRDHLRRAGREEEWTMMQGLAYGRRMPDAAPFPGVLEFMAQAVGLGYELAVVSHRTRQPILGDPFDLHGAASEWLVRCGADRLARIFLEESQASKAARVRDLGCAVFIDDLSDFLGRSDLPVLMRKILFVPVESGECPGFETVGSWERIANLLLAR